MTKRDILSIAFKIIGIYCVMYVIVSFPAIFMPLAINLQKSSIMNLDVISKWYLVIIVSFFVLMFIFAYILLKWGDPIAEKLIKVDTKLTSLGTSYNDKLIFILALRIIGALQFVEAIPKITVALVDFIGPAHFNQPFRFSMLSYQGLNLIASIVRLFIGAYLISGGKHLVQFVFRKEIQPTEEK